MTQLTASSGRKLALLAVGAAFFLAAGAAVAIILDTNASLWSTLEQSSMYRTYSKQNPNEAARVKSYWLNGGAKPAVSTKFGTFLVEVNEDRNPAPPPPPPPTDTTTTTPPPPPPTGYPSQANTGVPAGTSLTAYTGPSNVTAANTVITGKTIGCIDINAPGVVIRNSKIVCNGGSYAVLVADNGPGTLTIEDSEITCNGAGTALGEAEIVAHRLNIYNCENGFDINQNVTVEDSYIHDLFQSASAHPDGIQFATGRWNGSTYVCCTQNVTIRHNTIYGTSSAGVVGNAAIIDHAGGPTVNILIDNNLLAGGGYTLYCAIDFKGVNYRVTNNKFSRKFSQRVGYYGATTDCSDETNSGNVYYETGLPISMG